MKENMKKIAKEIVRVAYAFGFGAFSYYVLWELCSWFTFDEWWPFAVFTVGTYMFIMTCRNKVKEEIIKKLFNEYLPRLIDLLERAVEIEEKDEEA